MKSAEVREDDFFRFLRSSKVRTGDRFKFMESEKPARASVSDFLHINFLEEFMRKLHNDVRIAGGGFVHHQQW